MSVLLNNALTGLLAAQAGLRTTSNNTANVNTEGYSRQRINQVALPGQQVGSVSIGNGVVVDGVERIVDQFLVDQLRNAGNLEQHFLVFNELAQRVDGVLGDTEFGVSSAIQDFFDQLETVAHDPTSVVNRRLLLSQAGSLEDRINQLATQLKGVDLEINRRMTDAVATINTTTQAIARLNEQIVAYGDNPPNDLLDQRQLRIAELSELIDVVAIQTPDGAVNISIGNGRPLVLVNQSFQLEVVQDEFDPSRLQVSHVLAGRSEVISSQISGGALGGMLAFRRDALDPAQRELGLVAFGLTETFNQQHARGLDLNGEIAGSFFRAITPNASASANNSGTATVSADVGDAAAIEPRDYELRFNGGGWQVTDATTGELLSMTGSGTALDPFVIDGLEIVVTAGANNGDRFVVSPVREASAIFGVEITDPAKIGAGKPVTTAVSLQNVGSATISAATVQDATDPNLLQSVEIVFDDPTTFRIYDTIGTDLTGPLAYTSGADIVFNGWTVRIDGSVSAGDTFTVSPNPAGSGDNGNVVALSAVRDIGFFRGGQKSVNDAIGDMVAAVGGATLQSEQNLAAQGALRQQLELDVESVSGVNLDEEAVNALRYQEAFMASSKIVAMADELFISILNMVSRN
ncbi:MAG: flagellar hook-associated protein FlgK [Gammaproteobacteria bacterium]